MVFPISFIWSNRPCVDSSWSVERAQGYLHTNRYSMFVPLIYHCHLFNFWLITLCSFILYYIFISAYYGIEELFSSLFPHVVNNHILVNASSTLYMLSNATPVDIMACITFAVVAEFIQHSAAPHCVSSHPLLTIGRLLRISCPSLPNQHNHKRGIVFRYPIFPHKLALALAMTESIHPR